MPTQRTSKRMLFKAVSLITAVSLSAQSIMPLTSLALTQGPAQPEFSDFEPVGSDNLVNPFTGEFSYNVPVISIPGPNGMGYALSLSYHSGASIEDEASWVGYGWTLNPGAVNRMKRGFPDDFRNSEVKYWNQVRNNWTATATYKLGLEFFSKEKKEGGEHEASEGTPEESTPSGSENGTTGTDPKKPRQSWASLNGFLTHRYNNYRGYGFSWGLTAGAAGMANLGYTETDDVGSWSYSINPVGILQGLKVLPNDMNYDEKGEWYENLARYSARQWANGTFSQSAGFTGAYGVWNFNDYTMPTSATEYSGSSWKFDAAVEWDPGIPVGPEVGIGASRTIQAPKRFKTRTAYGYMYSGDEDISESSIMDYYREKESAYQKRDQFLSIPFSNADIFSVSGEGLGGNFRLHHRKPGHFRPDKAESSTSIVHVNGDVHLGNAIGVGAEAGYGWQSLSMEGWKKEADIDFETHPQTDEPYYFRFIDDLGGSIEMADNDDPIAAKIETNLLGFVTEVVVSVSKLFSSVNASQHSRKINGNYRSGRSSYIGYSTNEEMLRRPPMSCYDGDGSVAYQAYSKRSDIDNQFVNRDEAALKDGIGEFAITKQDGTCYVYGLPVYSRKEASFQYGLQGVSAANVEDNFLAYHHVPRIQNSKDERLVVVGEEYDAPYAATYLMTEILSPDYRDRTNNGPTSDDVGGYVRFNYDRTAGSWSKSTEDSLQHWYRWRTPYRGLHYQRNDFSDPFDDMGTASWGYKEIYYLESIETKTHVAEFITGDREDGFEAHHNEQTAASSKTATTTAGANKLRRLNQIKLYSKNQNGTAGKLLTTVNFEYDENNPLCPGLPNAKSGGGKLTLKRVWFEYEGVEGAYVQPYEFGYHYKKSADYPSPISGKYATVVDHGDGLIDPNADLENPSYSALDVDRWGNYQYNGEDRHKIYNNWVDQAPDVKFDPAAWQLKWIKLPSGGEMHIQYDQHTYQFVQDRRAMVMMSLDKNVDSDPYDNKFFLKTDDLGLSSGEVAALERQLKAMFVGANQDEWKHKDHMYFKFLYALETQGGSANINNCESEYISGYVKVKDVGIENGRLWVTVGSQGQDFTLPKRVCESYVRTSRANIIKFGNCDASSIGVKKLTDADADHPDDAWEAIWNLLGDFGDYYDANKNCKEIDCPNSYLRIPLPETKAKLGGGCRVKRVLMYDPGLESGADASLYGTEYLYETVDGKSSGVATNEPRVGREENALINLFEKRDDQNWYERTFAGEDREQFEGPIGESIMPAASIGYSRVVIRNIHEGKSGTGYVVNEYYTARDYPFDLLYSSIGDLPKLKTDKTSIDGPNDIRYSIYSGVVNYATSHIRRSQGFRFVLNSMHGQPRRIASYLGQYQSGKQPTTFIEQTLFEYFQPGEKVPVMMGSSITDTIHAWLGKEMEVLAESRQITESTNDIGIQLDFSLGLTGFIPIPFASGAMAAGFTNNNDNLYTYTTTKVVKYPAMQRRVIVMKDGASDTTEYLAFSAQSGQPLLVKSADGFHQLDPIGSSNDPHEGAYYSHSIPASWVYPAFGQKACTERMTLYSDNDNTPPSLQRGYRINKRYVRGASGAENHYLSIAFTKPGAENQILDVLLPGDMIRLYTADAQGNLVRRIGLYHVGRIAGNRVELLPTSISWRTTNWEVKDVNVEIVRSGRANRLTASAGGFTTYGVPPVVQQHPMP